MAESDMKLSSSGDWIALQRKVFTRWVGQKLLPRKITLTDVVQDFQDGVSLVALVEILSEATFSGKMKPSTLRVKQIDGASRAIQFAFDQGVNMKIKTSAENLVDQDEKSVLSLIWAIMQRFLKIGDDEEEQKLSAEEALLMWVQNQIKPYGLECTNYTKSFHNGQVLAALIHKNRPKLLSLEQMTGSNEENIALVQDAALKYFGMEKYINPQEFLRLDNKSSFIVISDFYYGIAAQRKLDLAARRIGKLIKFTSINDGLRADYASLAATQRQGLDKAMAMLNDREIGNTMAHARAKLDEYYTFKGTDKNTLIAGYMKLEALHNQLSSRLKDNDRPPHVPADGLTVAAFTSDMDALEQLERARGVELVAEFTRQINLIQLSGQHEIRQTNLKTWGEKKSAYLTQKEEISSSGAADYQLTRLKGYRMEAESVVTNPVVEMQKLGQKLADEKYEDIATVQAREAEVTSVLAALETAATEKEKVLQDDLARMKFKEATDLMVIKHQAKFDSIMRTVSDSQAYLDEQDAIASVGDAQLAISRLESFESDLQEHASQTQRLEELGQQILTAEYKSELSEWKYGEPQTINDRQAQVANAFSTTLPNGAASKRASLEASLATELEKERLRLLFANQAGALVRWAESRADDISQSNFGFDLAEVQDYSQNKMGADSDKARAEAAAMQQEATSTLAQLDAAGVTENNYTTLTAESLAQAVTQVEEALARRQSDCETELARLLANDALCQKYAKLANPLVDNMDKNRLTLADSEGSDEQTKLDMVNGFIKNKVGPLQIEFLQKAQAEIDEAGVPNNPHSHYTLKDIQVRLEQYNSYIQTKQEQLMESIEFKKNCGITAEQMQEIKTQFTQFDTDNSNLLDARELRAALYSLGEETVKSEIEKILTHYGGIPVGSTELKLNEDGFTKYMLTLVGDTNKQPEIEAGFLLLSKDEPEITKENLDDVFQNDDDINYLVTNMPAGQDGKFNYTQWTADVFSR